MLEVMTQAQIAHNHDIDLMVKTLYSHPLTIPDVTNILLEPKNQVVLETKIQFQSTHLNLTKL